MMQAGCGQNTVPKENDLALEKVGLYRPVFTGNVKRNRARRVADFKVTR